MNENDKAIDLGNEILIKYPYKATLILELAKVYHNKLVVIALLQSYLITT